MQPSLISILIFISFWTHSSGLKCRSTETSPQDLDMEYAVRQCLRQMTANNNSNTKEYSRKEEGERGTDQYFNIWNWDKNNGNRDRNQPRRENLNKGNYREEPNGGERDPEGGRREKSWDFMTYSPTNGRPNTQSFQTEETRNEHRDDFNGNNGPPPPEPGPRRRLRGKERPHSTGQQVQHDRETGHNYNNNNNINKPLFQSNPNNNGFQDPSWEESTLYEIEPCLIHCVFQELNMLDDRGRLSKQSVMAKLTRRLRDREHRDFLQSTVEECFDRMQNIWKPPRYGDRDDGEICQQSKSLAMCLEERGRQVCEDWDEPMYNENKGSNQQKNIDGIMNGGGKNTNNSKRGG